MNLSEIARLAAGTCGAVAAYAVARRVYDDVSVRVLERRTFDAKLDAYRQRQAIKALMHIPADQHGHSGWIVRPDGSIVNPTTAALFDKQWRVAHIDPLRERLAAVERLLLAAPAHPEVADAMPDDVPLIPEFVGVDGVLDAAPSYRRLVLGRTEHETVTADMASLVHVAVGGSSGWGKSVFLRWLVYQLIRSTDPVQVALIDLEGATLAPFGHSSRVLYPVADNERDAAAIMAELAGELDRRRELYARYPGVDSLYTYNDEADEPIAPIVTVIDEATALLENKQIEGNLRTLALRARKYGLWLVLAGQDWKASSLDTAIRNQLGARVHFRAMSASQSRVLLGQPGAEEIEVKGRAIAVLPGRAPFMFQSPMIKHSEIRGLGNGGPAYEMPEIEDNDDLSFDEQVQAAWDNGARSKSAICKALGGEPVGGFFYKVDSSGKRLGLWE